MPKELIEGFDYEAFQAGAAHCELLELDWKNPVPLHYKGVGVNVLPNGDLVGMAEIHHKYGTVLSSPEEVLASKRKWGDLKPCEDLNCPVVSNCRTSGQNKSPHFCECRKRTLALRTAIHMVDRNNDSEFCL